MSLREDALSIWTAGVEAVRAERLVSNVVQANQGRLFVLGRERACRRVVVVGAGKAGAGMAAAIERTAAGAGLADRLTGWVNVPADCVRPLPHVHLHAARPAGVNEPTAEGVAGAERILDFVRGLQPDDVCLVVISGGGSALLPAPIEGISLADKLAVTRFLMNSGATIHELNTVRKQLSRIKGGGLLRARPVAATMIGLIISDVVGDPLDIIASGPTVRDTATARDALDVLHKFQAAPPTVPQTVFATLERAATMWQPGDTPGIQNAIIGNNATAVEAARSQADALGYRVHSLGSGNQGDADTLGRELLAICQSIRDTGNPVAPPACVISGGEPVVHLAKTDRPRKGGRNQQLVLAAVADAWEAGLDRIAMLSGGTDGEDGPTDAAGACADDELLRSAKSCGLEPSADLAINNAYHFFENAGGLLKTGPTHTNVMDLRVCVIK